MELYTKDLCVRFATRSGDIPAVNHVSLAFSERQVTGIIFLRHWTCSPSSR